jgi:predicted AlkP superfamily phosphohydrolase/phosphomutase
MLLVIGLDGADWAILEPWLQAGQLPHLAALRRRGLWGTLRSTIRPESSIAWATFATGVNAGQHGIFGFSGQSPPTYRTTLQTALAIRAPTFWHLAAAAGRRLALLNVPMTYPPAPLPGGIVVAGMLAPDTRSAFVWPPDLKPRLLAAAPGYVIQVDRTGLSLRRFLRATTAAIRARTRAALWLLAQAAWDAAVIVFTETDRLQHYTLHLLDPNHPRHDPGAAAKLLPDLLAAYQALDEAIAALTATAGPEATVILLSDHGFAPCARAFQPNAWLRQQGLLTYRETAGRPDLWQRLRRYPLLRELKRRLPGLAAWKHPPAPDAALAGVVWSQTAAVYSPVGGIRFNIRGREPEGILDPAEAAALGESLRTALLALTDPLTGARPIQAVYRREELYRGPWLETAPDLILEPMRNDPDPNRNTTIGYGFGPSVFADSGDLTGNHTLDGIVLAVGPDIPAGQLEDAGLMDLAPTLLHALDLPVPTYMEGRVLALWSSPRPVRWQEEAEATGTCPQVETVFNPTDQALLTERLRALGYL